MKIAICGSLKFYDEMVEVKERLESLGHVVLIPIKAPGVDYWASDNTSRVSAKKGLELINEHFQKILISDAILVVNITKKETTNYIGANTFLEMGFAYYHKKIIYTLNPLPDQPYIIDELLTFSPIVLDNDLSKIR